MFIKKILLALFFLTAGLFSFAQNNKFTGTWEGTLNVGVELRIVFHILEDSKGGILATAESPDQGTTEIKCDSIFLSGETITIEMRALGASFTGNLTNATTIKGIFTQRAEFPLTLKKVEKVSQRIRPQTPQAPLPYKSEELEYQNADKSLTYGATITIPPGNGPFPALLITGSGAQNRDEEMIGHKPFEVLADHLTRQGFIILRVDDRGVGKSTGDFQASTSEDFAKDVNAGINYLLTRTETDKTKLGLIGHSEGGMIAPVVATQRNDINFIVLMAGPGVKIIDLMTEQSAAIMRSYGISEKAIDSYKPFYHGLIEAASTTDTTVALVMAKNVVETWAEKTSNVILRELDMKDPEKREKIATSITRSMQGKWFQYFMSFDPTPYLEKLNCKVLAINGDKDVQVLAKQNLPGIEAALKKSPAKIYEIKEIPGLNHLFQTCKKCTVLEYGDLEETIAPAALEIISSWLIKNVR